MEIFTPYAEYSLDTALSADDLLTGLGRECTAGLCSLRERKACCDPAGFTTFRLSRKFFPRPKSVRRNESVLHPVGRGRTVSTNCLK